MQTELLTPDLIRLFEEKFAREVERLSRTHDEAEQAARKRLAELEVKIDALAQHFFKGAVSLTLTSMLAKREDERGDLLTRLAAKPSPRSIVVAHPALVRQHETNVAQLREALNQQETKIEAARPLLGTVTVNVDKEGKPVLSLEASTSALIDLAITRNGPRRAAGGRSVAVVAGTRSMPKHTIGTARA